MSRPLFAVGEEVILQSVSHPEYNGQYVVEAIYTAEECYTFPDRLIGRSHKRIAREEYAYIMTEPMPSKLHEGECLFAQSALRKKYPPSDVSFEQLMSSLKVKEKA